MSHSAVWNYATFQKNCLPLPFRCTIISFARSPCFQRDGPFVSLFVILCLLEFVFDIASTFVHVIVCKICIREGGALHFARFWSSQLFLLPYMLPKSPLHLKCSICHFSALSPSLCPHIVTNSHEISFDLPVWAAYKILTSNCLRI